MDSQVEVVHSRNVQAELLGLFVKIAVLWRRWIRGSGCGLLWKLYVPDQEMVCRVIRGLILLAIIGIIPNELPYTLSVHNTYLFK